MRKIVAAVFAALKQYEVGEAETAEDLTLPCRAVAEQSLLKSKSASSLEFAVFCAAVFESAKLHPVIALGKNEATVGVWLYDSCFPDSVTDDCETVEKYVSEGINNLAFFDVKDLFEGSNAAYTSSQSHFVQKLKSGYYEYFADVKRCRLGGIAPLPLRGKSVKGYELIKETDLSDDNAPAPLAEPGSLGIEGKLPRNRQWERRLLDLTNKNALLNFNGKNALHLCCADFNAFYSDFAEKKELRLKGGAIETEKFGAEISDTQKELFALENHRGIARVQTDDKLVSECATRLFRRNREAGEETGVKVLYLAMGFLKYFGKEDGEPRYAPLVLCPVEIRRAKGNEDYSLVYAEEEYFVNTTLLEYLKQEFNIDVRALGGDVTKHKISELINIFLAETAGMKGWNVTNDVYVAAFSFQRYLMWNDIRNNSTNSKERSRFRAGIPSHGKNGACSRERRGRRRSRRYADPASCRQFAVFRDRAFQNGGKFRVARPSRNGQKPDDHEYYRQRAGRRSQGAFRSGKESRARRGEKRLDEIGVGDFCLELHSNKTDKADVIHRIESTMALKNMEERKDLSSRAAEIAELREELKAPMRALHKRRRLGVSVYQAILLYEKIRTRPTFSISKTPLRYAHRSETRRV